MMGPDDSSAPCHKSGLCMRLVVIKPTKSRKGITMKEILILGAGYTGMGATMGLAGG